jgi:hypothetical protein
MAAKNPGIGQGRGGGRPSRGERVRLTLDLTPEAAAILAVHGEAAGEPLWVAVDGLIRAHLGGISNATPGADGQAPALRRTKALVFQQAGWCAALSKSYSPHVHYPAGSPEYEAMAWDPRFAGNVVELDVEPAAVAKC